MRHDTGKAKGNYVLELVNIFEIVKWRSYRHKMIRSIAKFRYTLESLCNDLANINFSESTVGVAIRMT
jgi:hypothetical protein